MVPVPKDQRQAVSLHNARGVTLLPHLGEIFGKALRLQAAPLSGASFVPVSAWGCPRARCYFGKSPDEPHAR